MAVMERIEEIEARGWAVRVQSLCAIDCEHTP